MLAAINIGKALLMVNKFPAELLNDMEKAPTTTIRIANYWTIDKISPKKGIADRATKTGKCG